MAILQARFYHSAKFSTQFLKRLKTLSMKDNSGFLTLVLCLFLSLMFLVLIGFSLMSLGIKNSTQAQSHCLKELSQTQKNLGQKLQQLLNLNEKSRLLDSSRKGLDASIVVATASVVFVGKVPALQKLKKGVQMAQKTLIATQKALLIQSELLKKEHLSRLKSQLKTLKATQVRDSSFFKKALAVEKEEIGEKAYIYKPVQDFKRTQQIKMSWDLPAFKPLEKDLSWIFNDFYAHLLAFRGASKAFSINQSCAVTLEQKGEEWIYRLSH